MNRVIKAPACKTLGTSKANTMDAKEKICLKM